MAAITSALIAATAAVGGAVIANRGASKAADATTNAANQANATQLQIFNQQRADAEPWRQIGGQALNLMGQLYGFTPTFNPTAPGTAQQPGTGAQSVQEKLAAAGIRLGAKQQKQLNALISTSGASGSLAQTLSDAGIVLGPSQQRAFQSYREPAATGPATPPTTPTNPLAPTTPTTATNPTDWISKMPGYQFRLGEGTKALNTSWAANGMRESGAAEKALLRYGQDYASNEFNNEWNRLAGLAGVGQAVNNSNNALATNYANQTGANTMNAGAARASSYAQQGQNTANAFGYAAGRIANLPWASWGSGGSGLSQNGYGGMDNG